MSGQGALYLIPASLGDGASENTIPEYVTVIINRIDHYIVENERSARRYLKMAGFRRSFDDLVFMPLNKHTAPEVYAHYLDAAASGTDIGLISEAGCPAVADPGAEIVLIAHRKGIRVVPLTGPSSILLALMASGMNGQQFTFHGYLPIDREQRIRKLKELEREAAGGQGTQIFMETPFRNRQLLDTIINSCQQNTLLCIAADLTLPGEFIATKTISEWKASRPDLHKRPAIFLLG